MILNENNSVIVREKLTVYRRPTQVQNLIQGLEEQIEKIVLAIRYISFDFSTYDEILALYECDITDMEERLIDLKKALEAFEDSKRRFEDASTVVDENYTLWERCEDEEDRNEEGDERGEE